MAIANYLQNIKSSGIYRFVFDKSQLPEDKKESIRLVVGYSEKGPFNTPVFVENASDFKKIYGDISKKLERYGCYFHRSCLQALEAGPIYALNIKNFTSSSDSENGDGIANTVAGMGFDGRKEIEAGLSYLVENIYDTSRFWYLEPRNLKYRFSEASDSGMTTIHDKYISISATDGKNTSNTIFIRRYKPKGYDITFQEWYATVMNGEELPAYLEGFENEKLEDYFVKIYVFKGDLTDPRLQATDFYKKYFENEKIKETIQNSFGENIDALEAFAGNSKSGVVNSYTGIIFPEMITAKNTPLSIDSNFNADNDNHKMMLYLDSEGLYDGSYNIISDLKMAGSEWDMSSDSHDNAQTPYYLQGYVYGNEKPLGPSDDDKLAWQNQIIDALKGYKNVDGTYTGYKGLRIALTNRKSIEYHYLIDTFQSFVTTNIKAVFSGICKQKQNAVALLNFPNAQTIKDMRGKFTFNNTTISNFMDGNTINFEKLTKSTDENMEPIMSLASEEDGASFASYNTPITLKNPVTLVKTTVPVAALVSNCFMDKYVSRHPFSIVAGPNYAKIEVTDLVGPDYIYSEEDTDILEPYGVNCTVYVPGKGVYVNSNQTAKQNPETALSKLHIRELVIFLQDEIEKLLQAYQWEFNTQQLRDTVKQKGDVILETCKNNQGIYDYSSQCDEKNNPKEVIENEMLIFDYAIEPTYGAGKMVQQLTIYRTGGIKSATIA